MNYFRVHQTVASRFGRSGVILLLAGCAFVLPGVAQAAGCESSHTVQAGETLTQIAQQNGLSVDALAQANNISDANAIYANQSLCLSGGSAGDGFGRLNGSANGFGANAGSAAGASQILVSVQSPSEDNNRPGVTGPIAGGFAESVRNGNGPRADASMATGFGQPSTDNAGQAGGFAESVRNGNGPSADASVAASFGQPSTDNAGQAGGFAQSVRENANRPTDATGFGQFANNAGGPASFAGFGQSSGDEGSQNIGFAQSVREGGPANGFASQP